MRLLAIDTCLGACSAAILSRQDPRAPGLCDVPACAFEQMGTGHAERLFPIIEDVLTRGGLRVADLDAIAVTIGPGTFTGVRLGVAAARGLALAASLPVWTATSLAVLAATARDHGVPPDMRILAVADARNAQVYAQAFDSRLESEGPAELLSVADAAARVDPDAWPDTWIVGSGAKLVSTAAMGYAGCLVAVEPDARALGVLALAPADPPAPLYLRPPDAKPQIGKSLPRA
jgi:tRNA threonylcarbamoyladenosine biosynthesis protein TsaB